MLNRLQWTPELVEKFWSAFSASPRAELGFAYANGERLLSYIAPYVQPGNRYLDFGAGDGNLMRLLIQRGCFVAGYEPSEGPREKLLSQDFAKDPKFLGILGADATETFDVVIATEVIEHILDADMDAFLKRLVSFVRPGGTLIVTTPNNEDLDENSTLCPISGVWFHNTQHVRSFTAEDLDAIFSRLSFERLHDHRVDFTNNVQLYTRIEMLEDEVRYLKKEKALLSWLGPLYFLLNRKPIEQKLDRRQRRKVGEVRGDLRVGSESTLIYIGRLKSATPPPSTHLE